jgi:putative nucleotidyltransferase with HDIG domain
MNYDQALELMHQYTESDALRKHMYSVETAMRAYAAKLGEDEEKWGIVGLLHDFDYEKYPNDAQSATEEHPSTGVAILKERGVEQDILDAIMGHAHFTGVPRETDMAKTLFAVDELCGFLVACALVRPSRSFSDLKVKSVKKKLKDKGFARAVNREEIAQGAEDLALDFDPHVTFVIEALRPIEARLGLGNP